MSINPENFRPRQSAGGQHYLDASIRMATPARLRLMLLERAVVVAETLARTWRAGQLPGSNEHSLTLLELIGELLSGISGSKNPAEQKVCEQVSDLYVFLSKHLILAEDHSDANAIDEIRLVLEVEAETWRAVCAQELTANMKSATTTTPVAGGLNFSA